MTAFKQKENMRFPEQQGESARPKRDSGSVHGQRGIEVHQKKEERSGTALETERDGESAAETKKRAKLYPINEENAT